MKPSILGHIKKNIIEILSVCEEKLTPLRIEKEMVKRFADKEAVKKALRELILQNEICYTYIHGTSFVERSINKPMLVSSHVILVPAGMNADDNNGKVAIRIIQGGSFGNGHHPTTRISLRGIDFALTRETFRERELKKGALDIGTGSGVLAIAAVKLGMKKAVGVDIESIARKEALENVRVNGLSGQVEIVDTEVDMISGNFSLISANLRSPTLKSLIPHIARMIVFRGVVVISGIREAELSSVRGLYEKEGFCCIWEESEAGWSGFVLENRFHSEAIVH